MVATIYLATEHLEAHQRCTLIGLGGYCHAAYGNPLPTGAKHAASTALLCSFLITHYVLFIHRLITKPNVYLQQPADNTEKLHNKAVNQSPSLKNTAFFKEKKFSFLGRQEIRRKQQGGKFKFCSNKTIKSLEYQIGG